MMSEYAIKADGVFLTYRSQNGISIRDVFRREGRKKNEYQALRGISFSLEKGRILGIVGKNGSGKSTLLRAIGKVFSVDQGRIELFGNKVTLLSIGVGFDPLLTGRENIVLSGMLTGFTREEIRGKMGQIIEFAEIGAFIDKPVRTYSSGMYSKLAFAIATELNADILLIDEVLSVGDERFSRKSFQRMKELIADRSHTVAIVSHNLNILEDLCDEILWLHDGRIRQMGEPKQVLGAYKRFMKEG